MSDDRKQGILIVYDGQCPVCSQFVRGIRLREAGGHLRLQSAREDTGEVRALKRAGYDLNREMVLKVGDAIYSGADGMRAITLMSTPSGFFNRLLFRIFGSEKIGPALYPLFRSMRLLLLRIMGRKPIAPGCKNGTQS